ncbi:hypothetical protein L0F63_002287, partial [Massospora cicadina]
MRTSGLLEEDNLFAFVESLSHHHLDKELSALVQYCNQHPMIGAGLSEDQPPDHSSPSAM